MKRDMDLVRKLVFLVEERSGGVTPDNANVEGYTPIQIGYHLYLMLTAGLVEGFDATCTDDSGHQAFATSLTWAGHEFADAARSNRLWEEAKEQVKEKVGAASIAVMTQYLTFLSTKYLGM